MKIVIKKVGKIWEVNGKNPDKLQGVEKSYYEEYLVSLKLSQQNNHSDLVAENYVGNHRAENYLGEKI